MNYYYSGRVALAMLDSLAMPISGRQNATRLLIDVAQRGAGRGVQHVVDLARHRQVAHG